MADNVIFQGPQGLASSVGDALDEENLGSAFARGNVSQYVEDGVKLTSNDDGTFSTTAGLAHLLYDNQGITVEPDARAAASLPESSGTNHVYLTVDLSTNNAISVEAFSTEQSFSKPALKLGTIDTSTDPDTVTELARKPDGEFGSVSIEQADIKREGRQLKSWAFDGAANEDRLDAALTLANPGDTILLEPGEYTNNRTISTRGLLLQGVGTEGTGTRIAGDWTLAAEIELDHVPIATGSLTVDTRRCAVFDSWSFPGAAVQVDADGFRYVGNNGGTVTFASGTSGGVVDACTDTSVTDNGTNTVGVIG